MSEHNAENDAPNVGPSWKGRHGGCQIGHPHTHPVSQLGPTPDDTDD